LTRRAAARCSCRIGATQAGGVVGTLEEVAATAVSVVVPGAGVTGLAERAIRSESALNRRCSESAHSPLDMQIVTVVLTETNPCVRGRFGKRNRPTTMGNRCSRL
jgi:hypothetical protein